MSRVENICTQDVLDVITSRQGLTQYVVQVSRRGTIQFKRIWAKNSFDAETVIRNAHPRGYQVECIGVWHA